MKTPPIARNFIPPTIVFRDGRREEEVVIDLQCSQLESVHDTDLICCVSNLVRNGFGVSVDCGIKGVMLGKYAITRRQGRVCADGLKCFTPSEEIKREAGTTVTITEEIRYHALRKHLFIVFEPGI